jgi:hypothetical protein
MCIDCTEDHDGYGDTCPIGRMPGQYAVAGERSAAAAAPADGPTHWATDEDGIGIVDTLNDAVVNFIDGLAIELWPDKVAVYGYEPLEIPSADTFAESALDNVDNWARDEWCNDNDEDDGAPRTKAMEEAALRFGQAVHDTMVGIGPRLTCGLSRMIDLAPWVAEHATQLMEDAEVRSWVEARVSVAAMRAIENRRKPVSGAEFLATARALSDDDKAALAEGLRRSAEIFSEENP